MSQKQRVVVALGGNALGNTLEQQRDAVKHTARVLADLVESGNDVIVSHGNGPQVGMIKNAMEHEIPNIPLSMCIAISQSYIGYDLQNAIREQLALRNRTSIPVSTVVTQVRVDADDPAFQNPTKPIGRFMTKEEAALFTHQSSLPVMEDAGRGYRQVVASPKPMEIIELPTISTLVDAQQIVITCGGGGVPVVQEQHKLKEVAAVVDKDFISSKLAQDLDADVLVILTAVSHACLHYGTEKETILEKLTTEQAEQYIQEGHFSSGSMLPKMEAALEFAHSKKGRRSVITLLEQAQDGISGKVGTHIVS